MTVHTLHTTAHVHPLALVQFEAHSAHIAHPPLRGVHVCTCRSTGRMSECGA